MNIKLRFTPEHINLIGYQQIKVDISTEDTKLIDINCTFKYDRHLINVSNLNTNFSTLTLSSDYNLIKINGQFASNIDWSKPHTLFSFYINPKKNGQTTISIKECYAKVDNKDIRLNTSQLKIDINSIVGEDPNAVSVSDTPQVTTEYTPQVYINGPTTDVNTGSKAGVLDWIVFFILIGILVGIGFFVFKWNKSSKKE